MGARPIVAGPHLRHWSSGRSEEESVAVGNAGPRARGSDQGRPKQAERAFDGSDSGAHTGGNGDHICTPAPSSPQQPLPAGPRAGGRALRPQRPGLTRDLRPGPSHGGRRRWRDGRLQQQDCSYRCALPQDDQALNRTPTPVAWSGVVQSRVVMRPVPISGHRRQVDAMAPWFGSPDRRIPSGRPFVPRCSDTYLPARTLAVM